MSKFVRQNAFQFLVIQQSQDPLSHGNRGMIWIASRGKGIGRIRGNHIELRHGKVGLLREPLYYRVNSWQLFPGDRLRTVHCEGDLVREKVRNKIRDAGNDEPEDHSVLPAKIIAYPNGRQSK